MYKNMDDFINKIIQRKKIKSIDELRSVIKYWREKGNSDSDICQTLNDFDFVWPIKTIKPIDIIDALLKNFDSEFYYKCADDIKVYKTELEKLIEIKNKDTRKMMYCFLIYSKINDHTSGWIRYNKDFIFDLCGVSEKQGNACIPSCCKNGLELRVIGTKHSLICFHLDFKRIDGEVAFIIENYNDIMKKYNENVGGVIE